ncbi:MAG: Co2+/Mg2+ efflux protein ApaG [Flavobacteriales bacterium]|nr:Co2+/Mg2+ efflux protein ApaG [Flavobacteriales bacterium]MCB9447379.1 Co2+/Mg2+ efflux protein ApaG [Flavobacteriales bacterium]
MIIKVTKGIKISVERQFEPGYSNPEQPHFVFSYRITIVNESRETVQLMRRYWEILDSNGDYREVEGEGVVGNQPILKPGESYTYESACNLVTDFGVMRGKYLMVNVDDGNPFEVVIPEFQLEAPFRLN